MVRRPDSAGSRIALRERPRLRWSEIAAPRADRGGSTAGIRIARRSGLSSVTAGEESARYFFFWIVIGTGTEAGVPSALQKVIASFWILTCAVCPPGPIGMRLVTS